MNADKYEDVVTWNVLDVLRRAEPCGSTEDIEHPTFSHYRAVLIASTLPQMVRELRAELAAYKQAVSELRTDLGGDTNYANAVENRAAELLAANAQGERRTE